MIGPSPTQAWAAAHIGQCSPEVYTAEAARCAGLSWTAAHLAISSSGWRVWSPSLTRLRSSNSTWPVASTSTEPKRSEEHTSELQSRGHLVCRLLLEKKKKNR